MTSESGGVTRLCADLRRARERLGYAPQVSLEEGIRRTISAFQEKMSMAAARHLS